MNSRSPAIDTVDLGNHTLTKRIGPGGDWFPRPGTRVHHGRGTGEGRRWPLASSGRSPRCAGRTPPRLLSAADRVGDLLRLLALVSVVVGGVLYSWDAVFVFLFVFAVTVVPRIASLPRPVDIALAVSWLVAGRANAAGWYANEPWVDIPIHATSPGVTAAAVYLLLVRLQLVPPLQERQVRRAAIVLLTLSVGALLAVLWEFYEWLRYDGLGPPLVAGRVGDPTNPTGLR